MTRSEWNRRAFLRSLASLPLAGALGGCADAPARERGAASVPEGSGGSRPERGWSAMGIQLYSVRAPMASDPGLTLEALAALGYREVETAGLYGMSPESLRGMLDDAGLAAVSGHYPLEALAVEFSRTADIAAALGQHTMVVPWLPESDRTPDGYRRVAERLNEAGQRASGSGLRVGYHNHEFEFATPPEGGASGMELLLAHTDPANVVFELDLFWAAHAGVDPQAYLDDAPDRFVMVHAKDRAASGDMVAVGEGDLDFNALLGASVRHVFVEHDDPDDPLAMARTSIATLAKLPGAPHLDLRPGAS